MKKGIISMMSILALIFVSQSILSCSEKHDVTLINSNDGGDFLVVNMSTNDTLKISGGLTVGGDLPILNAKNGDIIKLIFLPNAQYKDYKFDVRFKVNEGKEFPMNNYEYEYKLSEVGAKEYTIRLNAKSAEQSITASGAFLLQVTE